MNCQMSMKKVHVFVILFHIFLLMLQTIWHLHQSSQLGNEYFVMCRRSISQVSSEPLAVWKLFLSIEVRSFYLGNPK